jgi:DNA-binding response OmpR family regulator
MPDESLQGPIGPGAGRRAQGGARRILVVDDDRDMCELLVLALTRDGYRVDCGLTCEEALARLGAHRYGLVISDYELPDGNAATWIRQATSAGQLTSTPVLIATAHPDPPELRHLDIVRKPFDPDQLLQQVRRMTERSRTRRRTRRPERALPDGAVELVLYVTAGAKACENAQQQLGDLTRHVSEGTLSLLILDVATHSEEAEEDKVVFTPTLVKRQPGPSTWVVGDLSLKAQLEGLLEIWGVTADA